MENSNETFEGIESFEEFDVNVLEGNFLKPWVEFLVSILMTIITIIGMVAHLLVLLIIIRKRSMQTSINLFLAAMAATDLTASIFCLLYHSVFAGILSHLLNSFTCHIITYFINLGLSMASMLMLGLVVTAVFKETNERKVLVVMTVILILTMVFELPRGYFVKIYVFEQSYCIENWPENDYKKLYNRIEVGVEMLALFTSLVLCAVKHKRFRTSSVTKTIRQKIPVLVFISILLQMPQVLHQVTDLKYLNLEKLSHFLIYISEIFMFGFKLSLKPFFYFIFDEDFSRELKMFNPFRLKKQSTVAYTMYNDEAMP